MVTFEDIAKSDEVQTYIRRGNDLLGTMGYTEHSFVHARLVAQNAAAVLTELGFDDRIAQLARMAGFMHDMGNVVNRIDHAQTGALLAHSVLRRMGMDLDEIATVIGAIGNHDEGSGGSISAVAAALILADKSDVRRSRVRNQNRESFDIHDRVNFAVEDTTLHCDKAAGLITLRMTIDPQLCPIIDYFEIFSVRMMMCRRAADFLNMRFSLVMNETKLI